MAENLVLYTICFFFFIRSLVLLVLWQYHGNGLLKKYRLWVKVASNLMELYRHIVLFNGKFLNKGTESTAQMSGNMAGISRAIVLQLEY